MRTEGTDGNFELLPEYEQISLVCRYCWYFYRELLEFKSSKSLDLEDCSYAEKIMKSIERFCDVTKCTTVKKLARMPEKDWHLEYHQKFDLRKIKKALRAYIETKDIKRTVDAVFGDGTYADYVKRTSGIRKTRKLRNFQAKIGICKTSIANRFFYNPYEWKKTPKSMQYEPSWCLVIAPDVEDISSKDIERHRKKGDLSAWLLSIKKSNFEKNVRYTEGRAKRREIEKSCDRLINYILSAIGTRSSDWSRSWTIVVGGKNVSIPYKYEVVTIKEYMEFRKIKDKAEKEAWCQSKRDNILSDLGKYYKQLEEEERIRKEELEAEIRERERVKEILNSGDVEAIRDLYHNLKIRNIPYGCPEELFYGGNVLMRYNEKIGKVETSKGMVINKTECARVWPLIERWHQNSTTFERNTETVKTTDNSWMIQRYKNDILIIGCHSIAYKEMRNLAKTLGLIA